MARLALAGRGITPLVARSLALALLFATIASAARPQGGDQDALLSAVADPAARQLLTEALSEIALLKLTVASLQQQDQQRDGSRRLQRTGEDSSATEVHIYTRSMQRGAAAPAPGRGRRQAQDGASGCWTSSGATGVIDVEGRTAEIHAACCGNLDDCSSGAPSTCDATCAAALLPFWDDCRIHLRVDKALWLAFHEVVRECQEADVQRAGESLCVHPLLPRTPPPSPTD